MDKIFRITIPVTPIQQNCSFLVKESPTGSRKAVCVDPGGNPQALFNAVKAEKLDLDAILLTHGHFDHIGAVTEFRALVEKELGKTIPVYGPFIEDGYMFSVVEDRASRFFPLDHSDDSLNLKDFIQDPSKGDRFFKDRKEVFKAGEFEFEAVHTPGHSPGHAILKIVGLPAVFVGDLVFRGSVGRTDLEGGSLATLKRSIRESIYTLDDNYILFPGHGPDTTVGFEREHNPYVRPLN